jgi:hypothetical protein
MLNDEQLATKGFRAIEDFIQFKARSDDLVARVFAKQEVKVVKKAFEKFLNIDPNIIAEYLAKYLDFYLKKT